MTSALIITENLFPINDIKMKVKHLIFFSSICLRNQFSMYFRNYGKYGSS